MIAFNCNQCREAPYIKEIRGCEKPTQTPAHWLDEDEDWYQCPRLFIPPKCWEFFNKYCSYKDDTATPPDFEKQSAKFNSAKIVYENYLAKFLKQKNGE